MIELDKVGGRPDKNSTKEKIRFSGAEEARSFLQNAGTPGSSIGGDEQVPAFANRTCYHIGHSLTCSQFHGGKAVLIGDDRA